LIIRSEHRVMSHSANIGLGDELGIDPTPFIEHSSRTVVPGDWIRIRFVAAPSGTLRYEEGLDRVDRAHPTALHARGHEPGTDEQELGALSDTGVSDMRPTREERRRSACVTLGSRSTARPRRLATFSSCRFES
jgi:hypothetical protein